MLKVGQKVLIKRYVEEKIQQVFFCREMKEFLGKTAVITAVKDVEGFGIVYKLEQLQYKDSRISQWSWIEEWLTPIAFSKKQALALNI